MEHLTEYNFTLLTQLPPLCVIVEEVTHEISSGSQLSSSITSEAIVGEEKFPFFLLCGVLPLRPCKLVDKRQINERKAYTFI